MKSFNLSKDDLEYLTPLDAVYNGLNVSIQHYIIMNIFRRLGIPADAKAQYNLKTGVLSVYEEGEFEKIQKQEIEEAFKKSQEKPEVKPANPPAGTGTPPAEVAKPKQVN